MIDIDDFAALGVHTPAVRDAVSAAMVTENKRLRAALDDIAVEIPGKLPPGWIGECFQSISDILNEARYTEPQK